MEATPPVLVVPIFWECAADTGRLNLWSLLFSLCFGRRRFLVLGNLSCGEGSLGLPRALLWHRRLSPTGSLILTSADAHFHIDSNRKTGSLFGPNIYFYDRAANGGKQKCKFEGAKQKNGASLRKTTFVIDL